MKISRIFAVAAAFVALAVRAQAITEGVEYTVLAEPLPGAERSVLEIWSYRCTHCWAHHRAGTLAQIAAAAPEAKVGYLIAKSMGAYGREAAEVFAFAEHLDAAAGRSTAAKNSAYHKAAEAYFTAYFKHKQRWGDGANPAAFYATGLKALGASKAALEEFVASAEGQRLIAAQDAADALARRFGTPGFVVNGKYALNIAKIPSLAALVQTVKELLAK